MPDLLEQLATGDQALASPDPADHLLAAAEHEGPVTLWSVPDGG
jgi:hypothetical protein